MRIKFLSLLLLLPIISNSQNIRGILINNSTKEPVSFASVVLLNSKGKIIAGHTTEDNGSFVVEYGAQRGKSKLQITFIGYAPYEKEIQLTATSANLGKIEIAPEVEALESATVKGIAKRVTLKGDTTELNAEAYKVNPDANAQDLVAKMPGISVQGGKVQAQGEDVKKVLVDGKEYFGSDVNAALGNISADMIDKIQVFDEQSEMSRFTGFNDGNTSKALNIVTKGKISESNVGRFIAGYGSDDRYKISASLNSMKGNRRLSIMAQSNNVNEQNFSISDIVGASGSSGRGGRGRNSDFMVNPSQGITKTNAFGLNYVNQSNKIKFEGSYFFNRGENENTETTYRHYITEANLGQRYNEETNSNSININHRFNARVEYKIDSLNSLLVVPRLTLQTNDSKSNLFSDMLKDDVLLNEGYNTYTSNLTGVNFSNSVLFRHKFNNQRTLTLGFDNSYSKNDGKNYQESEFRYYTGKEDSIMTQESKLLQNGWSVTPNVAFTQTLGRSAMLMLDYRLTFQKNNSDRKMYELDTISNEYIFNKPLSNVFESNNITNLGGLSYMYSKDKIQLNAKLSYQHIELNNEQTFPSEYIVDQSFRAVLPFARLMYRFTKSKSLMFVYRPFANAPSISQLQDVLDNSNPLQLRSGNPNLKQNFQHNFFANYRSTNTEGNSFFWMVSGRFSDNYIGNRTIIAPVDTTITVAGNKFFLARGGQFTTPYNIGGYHNFNTFMTYGFPVSFIKSNLNLNANFAYSRTPGIINSEINYVYQPNFGGGFTLSSNISAELDFTLQSNTTYNIIRNSTQDRSDNNYLSMQNSFRVNWIPIKNVVLQSDVTNTIYTGLSNVNRNYYLWNAAAGYKFLKNRAGELRLSIFDILKQNRSFSRNTSPIYTEDINNNTLTQYVMVSFIYNLRNYKGKAPQNTDEPERPRMMFPGGGPGGGGGFRGAGGPPM